jgi:type II secretory pathway pseudopilin PulG
MSRQVRRSKQVGFTIVELMVATLVFSVILIVITSGVIHFTASYYKGVHTSETQTTARNIASIIAQNLQYGGGSNVLDRGHLGDTPLAYACIGGANMYTNLGTKLNGTRGLYLTTNNTVCSNSIASGGKELLGSNMRLTNLSIDMTIVPNPTNPSLSSKLYTVGVGVAYGDDDLLCFTSGSKALCSNPAVTDLAVAGVNWKTNGKGVTCRSGPGSQFCAVSHLTTQVVSRFTAN